ncbi:MAG: hypothetical protein A2521_10450 [Deltaproteobacteria bacterium RIFOXYD12_FULL_57_12]|nr:MAG: hypothetical protein A2521_10450 [Deltaproteobacteria bacterium RIFOXYD12_FULL_57_12]
MDREEWQKKGEGHRQRLREKFLQLGINAFTDDEVLELLLTFGTPRTDCKAAARAAKAHFGTLAAVLAAPLPELLKIKGLGPKNIFALHFVQGVARRYLKQQLANKTYVTSSRAVADYLIHEMRDRKREVFLAMFLDAAHAIIETEVLAEGTVSVNTVYPRELVQRALAHNAAALVVAHNHPSGSLTPSRQDLDLTKTLLLVCSFMNIALLDHLIVGAGEEVYSFADHGIMTDLRAQSARLLNQPAG